MPRHAIRTDKAPRAIGTYSQGVKAGKTVYLSGQIPLDPDSMHIVSGGILAQTARVLDNLATLAEAAGSSLDSVVKLTVYLTDLAHFPIVNEQMARYFEEPYPARAVVGVAALPLGALVEMDAVVELDLSSYSY